MAVQNALKRPSREQILEFLGSIKPFNELEPDKLRRLADRCKVESYPKGSLILARHQSAINHLRLLHQGRVKLSLRDDEGKEALESFRGPGEAIGFLGLLLRSLSNLDVTAVEDTVCVLVEREDFQELIQSNPLFAKYFLQALARGYVARALSELERPRVHLTTEGSLYMFSAQVGDIVRRRPAMIPASQSVQEAARLMNEKRVGYLLVLDQSDEVAGIVTDRDLRTKVVASGQSPSVPVERIMSSPVQSIPTHTFCFDALLEMMKRRVHHLILKEDGRITSVVSGHDLMVLQGASPLFLVREIMAQRKIEGLYDLSLKSPRVVSSLIREGAKASHVTRLITMINDYILEKLLTLMQEELGPPPTPFCWVLMGSEGRREQTFRTDQDNGIVYADPQDEAQAKKAKDYFHMFGNEAIRHLVACGFPRCKGNIMASNPRWCQPFSVWAGYFDNWIHSPEPKDVLNATIFFDFRPGFGALELGRDLRTHLMDEVKGQDLFLRFLAQDAMTTPAATSFFRQFVVEKHGPHKNRLDLKTKGLVPFVDFGRIMSLKHGVRETNTMKRLQVLGQEGSISADLAQKAGQAYELQMQLRLVHQQVQHEEGLEPDNFIDPYALSEMERRALKDALGVVSEIKGYLKSAFRLGG